MYLFSQLEWPLSTPGVPATAEDAGETQAHITVLDAGTARGAGEDKGPLSSSGGVSEGVCCFRRF